MENLMDYSAVCDKCEKRGTVNEHGICVGCLEASPWNVDALRAKLAPAHQSEGCAA